jgi:hypothetical protein
MTAPQSTQRSRGFQNELLALDKAVSDEFQTFSRLLLLRIGNLD